MILNEYLGYLARGVSRASFCRFRGYLGLGLGFRLGLSLRRRRWVGLGTSMQACASASATASVNSGSSVPEGGAQLPDLIIVALFWDGDGSV